MERCGRIYVILVFILLTILGLVSVGIASAKTIYVPDDHANIQWAVDNASTGETIIVRNGIYIENIDITKSLTIKSENGSENCIIKAENSDDHVFEVTTDYVNISGFTVKGATGGGGAGLYISKAHYCNISNNIASNNWYGISLSYSSNSIIENNNANLNKFHGIYLSQSSNNIIKSNNIWAQSNFLVME